MQNNQNIRNKAHNKNETQSIVTYSYIAAISTPVANLIIMQLHSHTSNHIFTRLNTRLNFSTSSLLADRLVYAATNKFIVKAMVCTSCTACGLYLQQCCMHACMCILCIWFQLRHAQVAICIYSLHICLSTQWVCTYVQFI